ncbi:3750_t:CDS:2 [Funneliformis caledonium]|uniref:3750_t:CDS:1 n=1 Tax=Funneliformis caledonium TaxID=1117310 RepID=A0A9N9GRB0_9GLOM|nr:3750_t:CDS:2 [Funneliformis caledonium]
MSSNWCNYFDETEPEYYRFLGFYEYRSKQVDFTFSFRTEAYKLKMDLDCLIEKGTEEMKKVATEGALIAKVIPECCLPYGRNVRYGKLEPCTTTVTSECCLLYEEISKYINCTNQMWKDVLHRPLTPVTLPINVQLIIMEYNTLLTDRKVLREKWRQNWAKCDASMTEKEAKIFECVQLVTRNFFLNISSSSSTGSNVMDEDTFVHRYCHLMLEETFNVTNYKLFWANGELSSSKERRKSDGKKHGRKPDFRLNFEEKNEIVFGEIKPPCIANNVINHALIKLGEFMKGSLDSLHERFGYSQYSETFGIIIKGCQVELFGMDLAFDGLYRFKKIGRALLPTEDANFLNIVSVISNFYSLLVRVYYYIPQASCYIVYLLMLIISFILEKADRSIEELNRPSTPTGQSYHRESNSFPHKVHIPVLKIPPPALSD